MKARRALYTAGFIAALLLLWQALFLVFGPRVLTPPWVTFVNAWDILKMPDDWPDILESIRAFLIALLIAFGLGLIGGILIGTWRNSSASLCSANFNIRGDPPETRFELFIDRFDTRIVYVQRPIAVLVGVYRPKDRRAEQKWRP